MMAQQRRAEQRRRLLVVGGIVLGLVLIVGVLFLVQNQRDTTGKNASNVPSGLSGAYTVTLGDASAPTTITEYEDLQCPICQAYEKVVSAKVNQAVADGKVKVELHMVAFLDTSSTTKYSSRALNAAAVVLDTSGKDVFAKFHDLLYAHQPPEGTAGLTDQQLIDYAVQAGADKAAVSQPILDNKFHQWVVNATGQMSKDGVTGTPTVLVNGKNTGSPQGAVQAVLAAVK